MGKQTMRGFDLYLTHEQFADLEVVAADNNKSVATLVREAIDQYLKWREALDG